jgi:hypothetical protein
MTSQASLTARRSLRATRTLAERETDQVGLTLRLREGLRRRLEQSAAAREVSLNHEVNRRIEESFEHEARVEAVFGSEETYALARAIGSVIEAVASPGEPGAWRRDPVRFDTAVRAVNAVLESCRPSAAMREAK